ncbi:MAG: MFS transporter [Armatimonadetes bacterium]|nr:MFS transporter [Armatimonadota bacterium]
MFSVLRHRGFRNLWLGQAISQFGDACYYVIFMFMAQKLSGSAEVVGFVGAIEMLPFLLVGPYGGVLADRFDRKKIMLISDLMSGMTLIGLMLVVVSFQGKPPIAAIFVTAFLTSCFRSVFLPAKSAAIPNLVSEDELYAANSLSYMTQSWMPMIGLALSASVIGILYSISETWFFALSIAINALSFFVSAIYVAKLPEIKPNRESVDQESHPWQDFVLGMKYLWADGYLRALMILTGLMSLMISPFFVAYVQANKQWFGNHPVTLTWFEFSFFAGLLVGGFIVAKLSIRKVGWGFIFGIFGCGVCVAILAIPNNMMLFVSMNFLAGVFIPFADIPAASHMQSIVDDSYRGRVNSTLSLVRTASMPLGLGLAGTLIATIGLVKLFLLMGFGMVAVALLGAALRPFRNATLQAK